MIILEIISLSLITILCYVCTKSDLRFGMIYNRTLATFLLPTLVIDSVYYGFFARDLSTAYLINAAIVSVVSLCLFYSHSFAGGDCKMMIVIALLFPARFYWDVNDSNITLIFVIAFAILAGYCYLLGNALWSIWSKKVEFTMGYVKDYFLNFVKSYVVVMIYISLLNQIVSVAYNQGLHINVWIIRGICLVVAWYIGKNSMFKKWIVFIPTTCLVIIISFLTDTSPISLELENYIMVLVLMMCQMTIRTSIYENKKVEQLKKGMILTTFSSMLMQNSITKGLPGISTEDLKSRLSEEEIESIKIWAKATRTESVMIVKKIPFAIFISIGVMIYCAIWGLLL